MRQEELCEGEWKQTIHALKCEYEKFYIVPDYETEQDGKRIAEAFKDLPILTGGSGLLAHVLQKKIRYGSMGGRFCYVEAARLRLDVKLSISESIKAAVIL